MTIEPPFYMGEMLGEKALYITKLEDIKKINYTQKAINNILFLMKDKDVVGFRLLHHHCFSAVLHLHILYLEKISEDLFLGMYFCTNCYERYSIEKKVSK